MPAPVSYPTAREVAVAIVAAAQACDQDPIDVVKGHRASRARWYAFAALIAACPGIHYAKIARWCGFQEKRAENAKFVLETDAKAGKWWREDTLHEVKRALYAEIARTDRAAPVAPRQTAVAHPDSVIKRAAGSSVANPVLVPNGTKRRIPIAERVAKVARAEADKAAASPLPPVATGALDLSYRPDAPAHKRNVDIHTAELMGDPIATRSALYMRQHGGRAETKIEETADGI